MCIYRTMCRCKLCNDLLCCLLGNSTLDVVGFYYGNVINILQISVLLPRAGDTVVVA